MFISIVTPIYNEEKNIFFFYKKIRKIIKKIKYIKKYEIIFGNNSSTDKSLEKIKKLICKDKNVKVVSQKKNYGKNLNLLSALKVSSGDVIFILDVDCQDPPDILKKMLKIQKDSIGNVIYGYRTYENENLVMKFFRNFFYIFLNFFSNFKIVPNLAEYMLISNHTKSKILRSKYSFPFLRMDIAFHNFKCSRTKYRRSNRKFGKSNYNFLKLLKILLISTISCSYLGIKLRLFNKKKKVKIDWKNSIF